MRKKHLGYLSLLMLVALFVAAPAWAKVHKFNLTRPGTINGTQLEPGSYRLELTDSGEAIIYRGREMMTKARVEVKPLPERVNPRSVVLASDGSIREIRLKKQLVVFVR